MRLLHLGPDEELSVTGDIIRDIPPYAILSHTWASDDQEFKLEDVKQEKWRDESWKRKIGFQKILFCGRQAKRDGLQYFWVDTCCIDKTSSAELTEAINAMFDWYRRAERCYVYLSDVSKDDRDQSDGLLRSTWKSALQKSNWFARGWTLQELIAPSTVEFFSSDGQRLGDKKSLEQTIHEITRIPITALRGCPLSEFGIEERISWSSSRRTTRPEDKAYSLLGILGVHMPLIYSEGESGAFKRLRREIKFPIADTRHEAKLDQCLFDLRITDPRDDKTRIEQTKGGLLKGSYRWILDHPDFQRLRDNKQNQFLWIRGDPGKGKTMLLCGIIDELNTSPHQKRLVSFFFCQATNAKLNNATAVLRGLIYMLALEDRSLLKHVREEYSDTQNSLFTDENAWYALSRIFANILQDPCLGDVVFIIDALDECETGLPLLLDLIANSSTSRVKWIVSSRNRSDIEQKFRSDEPQARLSLELKENAEQVAHAILVYIDHCISELQEIRDDNSLQTKVRDTMRQRANGTFLWVALVFQELRKAESWDIEEVLDDMPAGLEELYERMIEQIDGLKRNTPKLCWKLLATVTTAYRPLHLEELRTLSSLPVMNPSKDQIAKIAKICGSFLTIRDDVVYFVHQSAKDFLLERARTKVFPTSVEEEHLRIYSRSIEALSNALRRDMYQLRESGIHINQIQPPNPDPLLQIRYACIYWVDHLDDGRCFDSFQFEKDLQDDGKVQKFIEERYLYWLESLSLLGSVSKGPSSMSKLLSLLQSRENGKWSVELVYDAWRFVRYHGAIISAYPLQIYASALIFSPNQSIIRKLFRQEEPEWLATKPIIEDNWSPCLQTLEGHDDFVNSVAFSPDSTLVASGSRDKTVRIWTADTGTLQQTLEGHGGRVYSVAFSPDSKLVASASEDKIVRIWAADTGVLKRMLGGHSNEVYSVAFSPDSKLVTSGSKDQTVRIWTADTGALLQTLEGHSDAVSSVAFSPNSKLLASASGDHTVRIWAADTGVLKQTLEGHEASVYSVTFLHDSKLVVSASLDATVRIWNADTGTLKQVLEGHSDEVSSVAASLNSELVVSACLDGTVRIWNAKTGALQQMLRCHNDYVYSVAFSPDSKLVASASMDKTVRIWTADPGARQQTIEGHDKVHSIIFSPDLTLIASVSSDKTVRIWATDTGALKQILEGHGGHVYTVAFSSDSKLVALVGESKILRIWAVDTGNIQQTLKGHSDDIYSVTFSPDSSLVASGSVDKTVRIWSADTGTLQRTLEGHSGRVYSVAFSPDSKLVASGSQDRSVRIWAVDTGVLSQTLEGHESSVTSVTFSLDSMLVASSSPYDHTVRIWAVDTGTLRQTIDVAVPCNRLEFNPDGQKGLTAHRSIFISSQQHLRVPYKEVQNHGMLESTSDSWVDYDLGKDNSWITFNGINILWLPVDYRPKWAEGYGPECFEVYGSTVAIATHSGRVIIMRFRDGKAQALLSA